MNRRGFTLIELLAVIVIIAIITVIVAPSVLTSVNKSKESSYQMLVKNIVIASKNYYEECEYGDLSLEGKYGVYACQIIDGNYIDVTLGALANTGFLTVNETDDFNKKIVLDPRGNKDISNCEIKIIKNSEKVTDSNGIENTKVSYSVESSPDADDICPTTEEYGSDN